MRWFRYAREAVWTAYWYEFCDRVVGWGCPTSKEPTITWEGNLQRRVHASTYRVLGCLLYLNRFKQRFMPQSWQVALVDQTFASICCGQVSNGHIADLLLKFTSLILPSLQECICSNYLFSAQTIWYLVVSLHLLLHPDYQPLFEMYIYSRSYFFVGHCRLQGHVPNVLFISTVWCSQLPIPLLMDNPINCTKYIWAEKLEMVSPCRWYDLQPRTTLQSLFEVLEGFSLKLWIVQVQPCIPCWENPNFFSIIGWSRCLPCRSWAFQDLSSG